MSNRAVEVLLVDDEEAIRQVCSEALSYAGYEVVTAETGYEALQLVNVRPFAAAIIDLVLPDVDGLSVLGAIREADPEAVAILITGYASLETAIEAVRRGAYDYLRKPFGASDLIRVLSRGLNQRELALRNRQLLQELESMNQDLQQKVNVAHEELTAFINLGRRLEQAEGALPVLADLLRACCQVTTASSAAVFAVRGDGGFGCLLAEGEAAGDLGGLQTGPGEALLARCARGEQVVIAGELRADREMAKGQLALLGLRSAMALPLQGSQGIVGVIAMFDPVVGFGERQASLVKVIALQAAEIVAQAALRGPVRPAGQAEFVGLEEILGPG